MNKAAQSLGRLARGLPKNFSAQEIERRRKLMAGINERKRKASKAKKRRMPNSQYPSRLIRRRVLREKYESGEF